MGRNGRGLALALLSVSKAYARLLRATPLCYTAQQTKQMFILGEERMLWQR